MVMALTMHSRSIQSEKARNSAEWNYLKTVILAKQHKLNSSRGMRI